MLGCLILALISGAPFQSYRWQIRLLSIQNTMVGQQLVFLAQVLKHSVRDR